MATAKPKAGEGLVYKGKPLMRHGSLIYYGSMAEKYIIMMQVLESKKVGDDFEVASRVSVQLQLTSPDLRSKDRVVKSSTKDGLYAAMDLAAVWLERYLATKT